ncbi:MAG TPA: hypothetical protein VGQ00_00400 [Candidatus Norongarragalinales archaeon]|jgi:cell division protein FtsB|nr:hypothetical protein [Candidatus Norongarragalinales archaeon]
MANVSLNVLQKQLKQVKREKKELQHEIEVLKKTMLIPVEQISEKERKELNRLARQKTTPWRKALGLA